MRKRGRIAFITTPEYREKHPEKIEEFVFKQLYPLCNYFELLSTGRTYEYVVGILWRPLNEDNRAMIEKSTRFPVKKEPDLDRWRTTILEGLTAMPQSIEGMIEVAYELVEGRLDAIIHLTDWADVTGKPDSMVLKRQANVHDVPIASNIDTAAVEAGTWISQIAKSTGDNNAQVFKPRKPSESSPLEGLTTDHKVLALIAHDGMKLDMCCFVVEYARKIFDQFDYILATGTTGQWIRKFALAAGRSKEEVEKKIRLCLSGPYGGDVQIAAAVMRRLCRKVIFLQDPFTSHAHETDIRLFEQAVLLFDRVATEGGTEIELATNVASAKDLLGL